MARTKPIGTRAWILWALTLSTLIAAPTLADDHNPKQRATTSRALALWGPSGAQDGSEVSRTVLDARLPREEPFPSRLLTLSDWLESPEFQISGSGTRLECEEQVPLAIGEVPEGKTELDHLTAQGISLLDDLEPASALEQFALAAQRLPCQQEFLSRESLALLPFYRGIAAYLLGDIDKAAGQFRQSAAINPAQPWNPAYPTEPQATFLSAVQEVIAAPKARVFGDLRGTPFVEFWLDGQQLDVNKAIERELLPGIHIIQALDSNSKWQSFVYRLDSGGKMLLFSKQGLERTILDGPDGPLAQVATALLRDRAGQNLLTDLFLIRLHPTEKRVIELRSFDPRSGTWDRLTAPSPQAQAEANDAQATATEKATEPAPALKKALSKQDKRRAELLREARYRSGAVASFKLFQLHRCPDEEDEAGRCANGNEARPQYMGGAVVMDIRMLKGLNLDIRLGMTTTDLDKGATLLPEIGIGAKYRFLTGTLQPYLGGGGEFFIGTVRESVYDTNNQVVVYPGLQGFGGLDIEFSDGFRITFEGGAGAVINPEDGRKTWPFGHFIFGIGRFL
ncbi:MAG: hypothetical protein CMP23_11255 [Rickettsiales bacterium]|nr:hypothetical protein [Rickettsiales bacterium]